jgi:hypothetical protein
MNIDLNKVVEILLPDGNWYQVKQVLAEPQLVTSTGQSGQKGVFNEPFISLLDDRGSQLFVPLRAVQAFRCSDKG